MTIQELGSLGEFVGSIVVLVTLIYLAVQVRHTKRQLDLVVLENRTAGLRELNLPILNNQQFAETFGSIGDKGTFREYLEDEYNLDSTKSQQIMTFLLMQTRMAITQHLTISDKRQRKLNDTVLVRQYSSGLQKEFWQQVVSKTPEAFDKEFVEYLNKLLDQRAADGGAQREV